jgi:hypothetical protein
LSKPRARSSRFWQRDRVAACGYCSPAAPVFTGQHVDAELIRLDHEAAISHRGLTAGALRRGPAIGASSAAEDVALGNAGARQASIGVAASPRDRPLTAPVAGGSDVR